MKRVSWLLAPALLILVAGIMTFVVFAPRPPSRDGRTLYEWIAAYERANDRQSEKWWEEMQAAQDAIRAIGTNALDPILEDLTVPSSLVLSPRDRLLAWLAPKVPFLNLPTPTPVDARWRRAIRGLEALGPIARPILPHLAIAATNNVGYGPSALMAVGPDAIPVFTNLLATSTFPLTGNLIGALANSVYADRIPCEEAAAAIPSLVAVSRSTDRHAFGYALSAMGAIHLRPEVCLPVIVEAMADPVAHIRQAAAQALGAFGDDAGPHVPLLVDLYDRADPMTRMAICTALGRIPTSAEAGLPVLLRGLKDRTDFVRIRAAVALGQLAVRPEESVPALAEAAVDPHRGVRVMTLQSLGQFGTNAVSAEALLESARKDPDETIRAVAETALRKIRGEMPPN